MIVHKVVVQVKGGLGNQMFQYALGRYLSLQNNAELLLDCSLLLNREPLTNYTFRDFDLSIFNIAARIAKSDDIPLYPSNTSTKSVTGNLKQLIKIFKKGYWYEQEWSFKFKRHLLKLRKPRIYISGYWQSYRYFETIESIIREDFKFIKPLDPIAYSTLEAINKTQAVCVHVRRTDFLLNSKHGTVSNLYLEKAMSLIKLRLVDAHFFIFSDDIDWCKSNIAMNQPITFVDTVLAGFKNQDHLRLMISCQHFIISNSTFSWWAAWLSTSTPEKYVIAPKNWFLNGINTDDLIPPTWERL